jgi:hypothetical protein
LWNSGFRQRAVACNDAMAPSRLVKQSKSPKAEKGSV